MNLRRFNQLAKLPTKLAATGLLLCVCAHPVAAAQCPGPGRWVSSDRDVLDLGSDGSVSLTLGALSGFEISGNYTVSGDRLRIVGRDANNRRRDLSLVILECHGSTMTTGHDPNRGQNPATPGPIQWQRQ